MAKNVSFSINQIYFFSTLTTVTVDIDIHCVSQKNEENMKSVTENKTNSNKVDKNAGSVFPDHSHQVLKEKCTIQHNQQKGNITNIPSPTAVVYSKTKVRLESSTKTRNKACCSFSSTASQFGLITTRLSAPPRSTKQPFHRQMTL